MNKINHKIMSNIHIDNINNRSKTTKINNSIFCEEEAICYCSRGIMIIIINKKHYNFNVITSTIVS